MAARDDDAVLVQVLAAAEAAWPVFGDAVAIVGGGGFVPPLLLLDSSRGRPPLKLRRALDAAEAELQGPTTKRAETAAVGGSDASASVFGVHAASLPAQRSRRGGSNGEHATASRSEVTVGGTTGAAMEDDEPPDSSSARQLAATAAAAAAAPAPPPPPPAAMVDDTLLTCDLSSSSSEVEEEMEILQEASMTTKRAAKAGSGSSGKRGKLKQAALPFGRPPKPAASGKGSGLSERGAAFLAGTRGSSSSGPKRAFVNGAFVLVTDVSKTSSRASSAAASDEDVTEVLDDDDGGVGERGGAGEESTAQLQAAAPAPSPPRAPPLPAPEANAAWNRALQVATNRLGRDAAATLLSAMAAAVGGGGQEKEKEDAAAAAWAPPPPPPPVPSWEALASGTTGHPGYDSLVAMLKAGGIEGADGRTTGAGVRLALWVARWGRLAKATRETIGTTTAAAASGAAEATTTTTVGAAGQTSSASSSSGSGPHSLLAPLAPLSLKAAFIKLVSGWAGNGSSAAATLATEWMDAALAALAEEDAAAASAAGGSGAAAAEPRPGP